MTEYEFASTYELLAKEKPNYFDAERSKAIALLVADLSWDWFKRMASALIVAPTVRITDIELAARAERRRINSDRLVKIEIARQGEINKLISENGLENALREIGATSLLDAIEISKGRKNA